MWHYLVSLLGHPGHGAWWKRKVRNLLMKPEKLGEMFFHFFIGGLGGGGGRYLVLAIYQASSEYILMTKKILCFQVGKT